MASMILMAAQLKNPLPPSPLLHAAKHKAVNRLVQLEHELNKGPEASPIVVANACHLREKYLRRVEALVSLHVDLATNPEADELYDKLGAFIGPKRNPDAAPQRNSQTAVCLKPSGVERQARKRGPLPVKFQAVMQLMQKDGEAGVDLNGMKEEVMALRYDASRDTCRRARNQLCAMLDGKPVTTAANPSSRQTSTIDK